MGGCHTSKRSKRLSLTEIIKGLKIELYEDPNKKWDDHKTLGYFRLGNIKESTILTRRQRERNMNSRFHDSCH